MTTGAQGMYYASAVQNGVQTLSLMTGGSTAATRAAYDNAYKAESTRLAAGAAMSAAQRNIAAVNQNKILSNVQLQQKQDQADAMVKVSAAAAGVEGTNVDNASYTTRANEAFAVSRANQVAEAQIEQYAAQAHSASMTMTSVQDQEIDYFGNLINDMASTVGAGDLQNAGTWWDAGGKDYFGMGDSPAAAPAPVNPQSAEDPSQTYNFAGGRY